MHTLNRDFSKSPILASLISNVKQKPHTIFNVSNVSEINCLFHFLQFRRLYTFVHVSCCCIHILMNWNCLFCLTIKGVFILFVLWKSLITTLSKKKCWKAAGSDPQSKQRKDMEWQQRDLKSFMLLVFLLPQSKKQKKSLTWKFLCTDKETHTYLNHERCDIGNRRDTLSSKKSHHKHAF